MRRLRLPSVLRRAVLPTVALLCLAPAVLAGQEGLISVPADSLGLGGPTVSPGGAFLRAVALPGWGHASIGSYNRAAVYFAAETATAFALLRTRLRIDEAEARLALHEDVRRQELLDGGTPADSIPGLLEDDEALEDLRGLVEARGQQQEDWAALGIFLVLLSGADAFVSAHLREFPEPIEVDAAYLGGGRVELTARVPFPRP